MKYMILSDIHGSIGPLRKAVGYYNDMHCDMLVILGDILNYGPRNRVPDDIDAKGIAELLNSMAENIVAVRGNCDSEVDQMLLDFPVMQTYMLLVDNGKKLFLTHGHIYNKENMPKGHFDAIVYGHTHLWELYKDGDIVVCNTGSITFPKQNRIPTFAVLENGNITIYALEDGKPVKTVGI